MVVDLLISFLGLPPIVDDVSSYYNFLLTLATFLFFIATVITGIISQRMAQTANKSFKIAKIEQINNEIKSLEIRIENEKNSFNNCQLNLVIIADIINSYQIHIKPNRRGEIVLDSMPFEEISTKIKRMSEARENLYFYDFSTGKNALIGIYSVIHYSEMGEDKTKNLMKLVDIANEHTSAELDRIRKKILSYNIEIETLIKKKEKLEEK
jgi:hypothetical protein